MANNNIQVIISDADAISALEESEKKYLAMREAAGFPLTKAKPNDPLPAWVLRPGSEYKREWAPMASQKPKPIVSTVAKEPGASILPPKPKNTRPREEGRLGTNAETVREYISEAMAKGETLESVILRCRAAPLSFPETKATRYVTENWARVLKLQKK